MSDSFFNSLYVIKVMIKVMQLTDGTAIDRSLPATTKLFRRDANWFNPKGSKKRQLLNKAPISESTLPTKVEGWFFFFYYCSVCAVPDSMKALVVPQSVPTNKKLRIVYNSIKLNNYISIIGLKKLLIALNNACSKFIIPFYRCFRKQ